MNGRKFFKVDHAVNIRIRSPISKIWRRNTKNRLENDIWHEFWRRSHFVIPVTATEYERTLSSAKTLVTSERSRLSNEFIEAIKCLKA